jgi:adenylylsulfate kinase
MEKGVTVWLTGLSSSGKTTLSNLVETELRKANVKVECLDGDIVRQQLNTGLGYSKTDRQKNMEWVAFSAKLLSRNGIIVLASFISPYQHMRDFCRQEIGAFIEVYVKCSLEACINRDVKGLYKKALNGEIQSFTGISDPFEEPINPEIILDTEHESKEESAQKILLYLKQHQYIA